MTIYLPSSNNLGHLWGMAIAPYEYTAWFGYIEADLPIANSAIIVSFHISEGLWFLLIVLNRVSVLVCNVHLFVYSHFAWRVIRWAQITNTSLKGFSTELLHFNDSFSWLTSLNCDLYQYLWIIFLLLRRLLYNYIRDVISFCTLKKLLEAHLSSRLTNHLCLNAQEKNLRSWRFLNDFRLINW